MNFSDHENKFKGQRCFILGSAPSILEEDLSLLKNEKVIVVNQGYSLIDHGLPNYDYYVCCDPEQYCDTTSEIKNNIPEHVVRFYSPYILDSIYYRLSEFREPAIEVKNNNDNNKILENRFPSTFYEGWKYSRSVIFDATIIAKFLGFSEIYWLGVDFNYAGRDQDTHFFGSRSRPSKSGENWQDPFLVYRDEFEKVLTNTKHFLNSSNVRFVNLSRGFKLTNLMETDLLENIL